MDFFNLLRPGHFRKQNEQPDVPKMVKQAYTRLANDRGMFDQTSLEKFASEYQKEMGLTEGEGSGDGLSKLHNLHGLENPPRLKPPSKGRRHGMGRLFHTTRAHRGGENGSRRGVDEEIGLAEFFSQLLDPKMWPAVRTQVTQDMTAPLSQYYIYTGHNSYLKGNQLTSDSSVEPIIMCLKRGVRVIELDLWPNDKKTEILVMHGGTLTKPVAFEECIHAIKENAFVASPYPVIITLEDHLTNSLQAQAAKILTRVLGDLLWVPSLDVPMTKYPSPEALKGRIVISTQPPKMDQLDSQKEDRNKNSLSKMVTQVALDIGNSIDFFPSRESSVNDTSSTHPNGRGGSERIHLLSEQNARLAEAEWGKGKMSSKRLADSGSSDDEQKSKALPTDPNSPLNSSIIDSQKEYHNDGQDPAQDEGGLALFKSLTQEYLRMIGIPGGRMKGETARSSLKDGPTIKRVSLSESQLLTIAKTYPDDLIRFTQNNILRIYPTGIRVDSSNYNPMPGWTHGAQLVAFNMQGYGRPLWLVHGFFMGNGGCGYIKKPDVLFGKKPAVIPEEKVGEEVLEYWNPKYPGPVKKVLRVRLLVGTGWLQTFGKNYYDTFSPPDFYAKIGISGVDADTEVKKLPVRQDMWCPQWEEHTLDFPLTMPDLALLRIEVFEYDQAKADDFAGQVVLPVAFLEEGFRCVPLLGKKGNLLGSKFLLAPQEARKSPAFLAKLWRRGAKESTTGQGKEKDKSSEDEDKDEDEDQGNTEEQGSAQSEIASPRQRTVLGAKKGGVGNKTTGGEAGQANRERNCPRLLFHFEFLDSDDPQLGVGSSKELS